MKDMKESVKKLNEQKSFDDFYSVGGKFMSSFLEQTPSLECKDICNKNFNGLKKYVIFIVIY